MSESETGVTAEAVAARHPTARICLMKVRILKLTIDLSETWHNPQNLQPQLRALHSLILPVAHHCQPTTIGNRATNRAGARTMWELCGGKHCNDVARPARTFGDYCYFRVVGRLSLVRCGKCMSCNQICVNWKPPYRLGFSSIGQLGNIVSGANKWRLPAPALDFPGSEQ